MAKRKALPLDELKLFAWRVGMKLGSAIDRHRHAHWHLKQMEGAPDSGAAKPDVGLPYALANEVGMMQDFEACIGLAKSLGYKLAPLEGSDECRKLFYRANKLTPKEVEWIPGFLGAVDKRVEAAYDEIKERLKKQGQPITSLFDLAVHVSMTITSPDEPANISRLASEARVPPDCLQPFLTALSEKVDADEMRKELARLDKCVERSMLYDDSAGSGKTG
ncbi:MAG: hypothetical protein K2Y37_01135 [Pirellulales bacterium]|nr:hypothetical protein [Pirellulales bacterium]